MDLTPWNGHRRGAPFQYEYEYRSAEYEQFTPRTRAGRTAWNHRRRGLVHFSADQPSPGPDAPAENMDLTPWNGHRRGAPFEYEYEYRSAEYEQFTPRTRAGRKAIVSLPAGRLRNRSPTP